MNYSLYKIFLNDTFELARTMVIKIDWVGKAMNRRLTDYGQAVPVDRHEWRYYKHLSGQYHHLDQDMIVKSLDDSTDIVFNRENLKYHKKTRSVYLYNRAYVDALKKRYPEQTVLINGILHPVDIDVAINASDGTILWYPPKYVEPQEYSLISDLEKAIRGYLKQVLFDALCEVEDLFVTMIRGQLAAFSSVMIMDIRNKYVRSPQTHSFHIMAYLASNQRLDEFVPYLTLPQMMFLYRNILYLERNIGQQETFDWLVEKLLSVRNLPVYDYTLRQRDMDLSEGELSPYPIAIKNQLNLKTGLSSRDLDVFEIEDIVYKERPLALHNDSNFVKYVHEAEELTSMSSISNLPTKVLEVSAIDPDDIDPIKLIDVVLNEWMDMSTKMIYTSQLEILNPLNGDMIRLDPKEMFLLYIYSHMAGFHGIHMKDIPLFIAKGPMSKRDITREEYLSIVEFDHFNGWEDEVEFYTDTYHDLPTDILSAEEFLEHAQEILKRKRIRHQYTFQPHRHNERIARRVMYNYSYPDQFCEFKKYYIQNFDDFFIYTALDREKMSRDAWKDLAMQALDKATLYGSMNKISLKEIQAAMIRLFRRLSSYTIQFIEEVVGNETISTEPLCAILGTTDESTEGEAKMQNLHATIEDCKVAVVSNETIATTPTVVRSFELIEDRSVTVPIGVGATAGEATEIHFTVRNTASTVRRYNRE